jgi:hypothetical protein
MKKQSKLLLSIIILGVLFFMLQGCATIYVSPEFESARQTHKTIALIPFEVTIDAKQIPKDMSREVVRELENDEAVVFQQQLFTQFLQRQMKGEYTVEIQDIDKTNRLLNQAGINLDNLGSVSKEDIARTLEVDAVISGSIRRTRPMSTGTAVALGLLVGVWGPTNKVDVTLNIHESQYGKLLWQYEHQASGSVGSSSEGLARSLMKGVSKKFPYKKKA